MARQVRRLAGDAGGDARLELLATARPEHLRAALPALGLGPGWPSAPTARPDSSPYNSHMKFTVESFRAWPNKRITLLGMSGVGKTHISSMLRGHDWFHFSGDYRIGTRYLDEPILDIIKQQAMQVPFLRDLLRRDWIDIKNNIKIHDLGPVLTFVGKLGDPEWGGLSLDEFSRRQAAVPRRRNRRHARRARTSSARARRSTATRTSSTTSAAACANWTNPAWSSCWPSTR